MDQLNINDILNRNSIIEQIEEFLNNFKKNKENVGHKRGIYIYGDTGIGKTYLVKSILKKLNYDIIYYDTGDIRNKNIIESLTSNNIYDKNIINLFTKKITNLAIVMDEIDSMNNGDKGGINYLIKLIRPKKTKKQKKEQVTLNPIICIGNNLIDKKIKELMKGCLVIKLEKPLDKNIETILFNKIYSPKNNDNLKYNENLKNNDNLKNNENLKNNLIKYIGGDLRKLKQVLDLYDNNLLNSKLINNSMIGINYNLDIKLIIKKLLEKYINIYEHNDVINETNRTTLALMWHENIIDYISSNNKEEDINLYLKVLDNFCYADNIDRITFQNQIWQFNEMSSCIKTIYNNNIYQDYKINNNLKNNTKSEIRFTKILTKYSSEYNNYQFLKNLSQSLSMDLNDILSMFNYLKKYKNESESELLIDNMDITNLEISRIYKYLNILVNGNDE
tara:strand:- start:928 stop:2271 length:1344 start_codon:yes stop_codon:yes gene_type:complete